jgi:hypothetical protein
MTASEEAKRDVPGDVKARLLDLFRDLTERLELTQVQLEQLAKVRSDIISTLRNGLELTYREIAEETGLSVPRVAQLAPEGTTVSCGDCGTYLTEPSDTPAENRTPCPVCGSLRRTFGVTILDSISASDSAHLSVGRSWAQHGSRTAPSMITVKRLFADSGNVCAFPGCESILKDAEGHAIGEFAHIRSLTPDAPRYDPSLTPEGVNDYDNLLLLCPTHHAVIDRDPARFDVEYLRRMKRGEVTAATIGGTTRSKMSASQYRGQLHRKRQQRIEAEKRAAGYRGKETTKRSAAAKARAAAGKTKSSSTATTKAREAERAESDAAAAGKEAARWQEKVHRYGKEEAALQEKVAKAEKSEADEAERRRKREEMLAHRRLAADSASLERRVHQAESDVERAVRQLRSPKPEKLRVLLLGAGAEGDLRVGREQKRIRAAVESALHRDLIELDVRPAATTWDLLDGITRFRPHVVHFSGHSDHELILFEEERDEPHEGVVVTADAFTSAVKATDDPPLLVLLNSCNSASHIHKLVEEVVPFAIGMADEIDDGDAITYAAQFYASVANGQSIRSAHLAAQAALELAGLSGVDLPTLAWAADVDPVTTILVRPAK